MKINICILEDETAFSNSLSAQLKEWADDHRVTPEISVFSSQASLLSSCFSSYDVIFMDIELPDGSGIETAKLLRKQSYEGEIIFLTAHQEYACSGYSVHAMEYLLKPVDSSVLNACMEQILRKISDLCFIYRKYGEHIRIRYYDILYFSSQNQHLEIYTADNVYRQLHSLKELLPQLPPQFIQCHRSIIVNIDHVQKISGKDLFLSDGTVLPISSSYLQQVRNMFCKIMRGEAL